MLEKLSRRHFLAGSTVLGLSAALAACAPKATPEPAAPAEEPAAKPTEKPAEPAAPEKTVVRFMSREGAENIPLYESTLAEDFAPNFPNIEVSIEPAPDGWTEKLLAQMVAGTAVDLFQAWGNIFFNWTERGLLLDCNPYVDATMSDSEVADYNDFQWEGLEMRGVRVGMPKYINLMTITFNKDAYDKYGVEYPPEDGSWTVDDYVVKMQELDEAIKSAGDEGVWPGWKPMWAWDRFWNILHIFGGKMVNEKYGKTCEMDSEESQAALQWAWDLEWTSNLNAQPAQVENKWFRNAMNPGFVLTAESGTYPITTDKDFEGSFRWDMRHVPQGRDGQRSVLGTTDAWSITKQTKVPDESWELLHFISGPVFQKKAVVGLGRIPVLKSLIESFIGDVRAIRPSLEDVRLETISEILDWGYAEDGPWFDKQTEASEIIRPALEKVFTVGDAGPEYFIEIAQKVNESQT